MVTVSAPVTHMRHDPLYLLTYLVVLVLLVLLVLYLAGAVVR